LGKKLFIYLDGASRGNPGEAGYGIVIKDEHGKVLHEIAKYIGRATNNVAEYEALLRCLEEIDPAKGPWQDVGMVTAYSDSELLVRQVRGDFRVRNRVLKEYFQKILRLIKGRAYSFEIQFITRKENKEADRLANRAINLQID